MEVRRKARARHLSSSYLQCESRRFSRRPFSRGDDFENRPAFTARSNAENIPARTDCPVVTNTLAPTASRDFSDRRPVQRQTSKSSRRVRRSNDFPVYARRFQVPHPFWYCFGSVGYWLQYYVMEVTATCGFDSVVFAFGSSGKGQPRDRWSS